MSYVPEQARKAAERANELMAQATGTPADPVPVEVTEPAPVAAAPEVPPAEPPVPVATPTEDLTPPVATADAGWEQKYKTVQGVLRAETAKLRAVISEREATIMSLQAQVNSAPPAAPVDRTANDPRDEETYGPEMLDLIERRAAALVKKELDRMKPQFEQTQSQVENISRQVYKNDEDRFYGELERAVPDYSAVNADPRWLAWLGETDPLSGMPRQAYLDNAAQTMDPVRTANLFQAFKATIAPAAAPAQTPAPSTPAMSPSPRPVGAASAPRMQAPGPGEVRRSQIGHHYKRVATDQTYRESAEATDFVTRMNAAMAAGTIVEG